MNPDNNILDKLIATQEFATIPSVTMKILELLENDEDIDIRVLSNLIETDASLTLKLIKVANSPLFAMRGDISSVQQAIITLGLDRVTNIVLGISIFSKIVYTSNKEFQEIIEKYWWHTASTAIVSKSIAKKLGLQFREYEFIGGLFHDIGKLSMLQYNSTLYQEVINSVQQQSMRDIEAEKLHFGVDHTEVGAGIVSQWKLPKEICNILKYQDNFNLAPEKDKTLIAIVNLANMLCSIWGADFFEGNISIQFSETSEWRLIENIAKNKDIDFEKITFELEQDYNDVSIFLNIMKA